MSKVKEIDIQVLDNGTYIVFFQNRYFEISEVLYDVLRLYKEDKDLTSIKKYIVGKYNFDVTDLEIEAEILKFERIIFSPKSKNNDKSIIKIVEILKPEKFKSVLLLFSRVIPGKKYFGIAFIILLLLNIFFVLEISDYNIENLVKSTQTLIEFENWKYWILFYLVGLIIVFTHEMFHAASAKKYNVLMKEMGLGYYMFSIVFYVDLTDLWRHDKSTRIITNLSGIYSQLIVGVAIAIIAHRSEFHINYFLKMLLVANLMSVIYNLLPFFKTDGYWVISDYYNISNLRERSFSLIWDFRNQKGVRNIWEQSKTILIYTSSTIIFFTIIFAILAHHLFSFFTQYNYDSVSIKFIFNCFLLAIFLYTLYFKIFKRLINYQK